MAKYLAHGRYSNMVMACYDDDVRVSHRQVHFCACAHVLYEHVCVHTTARGGDGRTDGMRDPGRLCVPVALVPCALCSALSLRGLASHRIEFPWETL